MDVNNENENGSNPGIELGGAAMDEAHSNAAIIIDEQDYQPMPHVPGMPNQELANAESVVPAEENNASLGAPAEELAFIAPPENIDSTPDDRSVEQILGDEIQATEANQQYSGAVESVEEEGPSLCLQITPVPEDKKAALQAALAENGINLSDEELRNPKLSRLQEAHALQIMQSLTRIDCTAKISVQWPGYAAPFTEEEDPLPPEGAPAVVLPSQAKGVLLVSSIEVPGFVVRQTLDLVSAHKNLSRRFFKEEELQNDLTKELKQMQRSFTNPFARSSLERVLRELCSELQRKALNLGANAVIGIRLECHAEQEHLDPSLDQMRLIAIGTASVVEK